MTSIISAAIGAGLMLLAIGGGHPAGIEGWVPLNDSVALALSEQAEAPPAGTGAASTSEVQGAQTVLGGIASGQSETAGKDGAAAAPPGQQANQQADQHIVQQIAQPSAQPTDQQSNQSGLISINTASSAELQDIPGIGAKKAQAIIDYRTEHGPFRSVNDLTKVKGIGDKMLEKMKPHIGL